MKNSTHYTQTLLRALAVLLLCLAVHPASAQSGPPPLPTVPGSALTFWRFDDTNWLSDASLPPLVWTGIGSVPSWDGNALEVDNTNPAGINYRLIENNGHTNLTLDSGTLRFWFKPNWTSTNLAGTGPGDWGRLIDVGLYTTNAAYGWWSLYFDPAGTFLSFSAQTNGTEATYLSTPIAWSADAWHLIALTYSASNSALYLDGQLATNGPGVTCRPAPEVLTNGFYFGSDYTGWEQAHGQFEDLKTWNYPLDGNTIHFYYTIYSSHLPGFSSDLGLNLNPNLEAYAESGPPSPGGTNNPPSQNDLTNSNPHVVYGTNDFWLEILPYGTNAITQDTNFIALKLHGTTSDIAYQILSKHSLTDAVWTVEQNLLGATDQNWTPASVSITNRPTLFFKALAYTLDTDGDGLPDWWEIQYGLDPNNPDTGNTGTPDGYKQDTAGDGWTNLQKYQMGIAPGTWATPPNLTGFNIVQNANGTTTLSWNPSPGPVIQYIIKRADPDTFLFLLGSYQTIATLGFTNTSYVDNGSFVTGNPILTFSQGSVYQIEVVYSGGNSPSIYSPMLGNITDSNLSVNSKLVRGPNGRWQIAFSNIPGTVQNLQINWAAYDYLNDWVYDCASNIISVTNLISGCYTISDNVASKYLGTNAWIQFATYGDFDFQLYFSYDYGTLVSVQGISSDGHMGPIIQAGTISADAPYFVDGRRHLKQSLAFLTRAAGLSQPYSFPIGGFFQEFNPASINFVELSFIHPAFTQKSYTLLQYTPFLSLDNIWPFTVENQLARWLYSTNQVPNFVWQPDFVEIPSLPILAQNGPFQSGPYWIAQNDDPATLGATVFSTNSISLGSNLKNLFGLPLQTALVGVTAYDLITGSSLNTTAVPLAPGTAISLSNSPVAFYFSQAGAPTNQTVDYYFASVISSGTDIIGDTTPNQIYPLPLTSDFAVTNQTPLLIGAVGQPMAIGGWAKQAINNGNSNKFAYLGQYFDKAFKIDANGNVTTNETGILSPYGEFFPTEPGQVALVTMPDIDNTNQRGTGVVNVIKLQLDVNHDGIMDQSFAGPDNTSADRPFTFWANNDYDRIRSVDCPLACDIEQDDYLTADCPYTPNVATPDYAYRDAAGHAAIPCLRDLEDYTRLWMAGLSNVMAVMPTNYTVKLVLTGDSQLRIFRAHETDGGTNYLFDSATASNQVAKAASLYIGLLTSDLSITLSGQTNLGEHFIFCGAQRGSAQIDLQVLDGNQNMVADTTAYVQIQDIKEMFERWTVGDEASIPAATTASLAQNGITNGMTQFQYSPPTDANTPYILFVHGWNMEVPDKDRFAETAFKRLYWQGYQGRFGSFRWPTGNRFNSLIKVAVDARNYDNSESNAWSSATGLLNKLTSLNAQYPGKVYLMAHSMGNVVAGEALRLAGTNQVVNTYIAMEAAIPAHCYDASTTNRSSSGPPDRYAHYSTDSSPCYFSTTAGAGNYVNFYNQRDFALGVWNTDQDPFKPDNGVLGVGINYPGYFYSSSGGFYKILGSSTNNVHYLTFPANTYEIFAYADRAWSYALGAQPNVGGAFLKSGTPQQVNLDVAPYNFGPAHKGHSAQFRSDNMQRWPFWEQLLFDMNLKTPQ